MAQKNTHPLAAVGPIDPRTGFPLWYEDSTGRRLELVWQPGDDLAPVDLDAESGQLKGNAFPGEAFYMLAEARMVSGGGPRRGRVRVVLALEATFGGTGDVVDGQQIVFGRTRFRIDDALPNQKYTLTHPYGVMDGTADDKGRVFVTEDIGVTPRAFSEALRGGIAPFLVWESGLIKVPGTQKEYIGDGRTAHRIKKTQYNGDHVLVEGPGINTVGGPSGPAGTPFDPDKLYTDLFVLQGKIATLNGADVPRAVYSHGAGNVVVDVFARSIPGQTLRLSLDGVQKVQKMPGGADTARTYFAQVDAGPVVPLKVAVQNMNDPAGVLPATEVELTDDVHITRADYDSANKTLTVEATSGDGQTPPTLELTGDGLDPQPLNAGTAVVNELEAPPPFVTVTSTRQGAGLKGGEDTRTVKVVA